MKKMILPAIVVLLTAATTFAQDLDISIGKDGIDISRSEWYENPLVWVGALLAILILVLLMRRSKA